MNAIQVQCGHCKRRFAAKPHLAGKRVKCPGCTTPIVIPDQNVITSIEVTCGSCAAEFLAESSDVGQHVACPACGTLTQVSSGAADVSFSSADSVASGDPLFDDLPTQGASPFAAQPTKAPSPLASPTRTLPASASGGSLLTSFWALGVVAIVALLALVLCLVSGHFLVGIALVLIGLAIAGISFVVPPPKKDRSSGIEEVVIASVAGGVLLLIALIIAFVAKSMVGEELPANPLGPLVAFLFAMLVVAGAMILFVFMVVRFGFSRAASAMYGGVGIVVPLALVLFAPAAVAGPEGGIAGGSEVVPAAPPVGRPGSATVAPVTRTQPLAQTAFPSLGVARSIAPEVDFHEVRLKVPSGKPGQANKLFVYIPKGSNAPKSLPCVFIVGAGAVPLTGMTLSSDSTEDQPEQLPYAQAGFVVVAYEIDGYLPDPQDATDQQYIRAVTAYQASEAGRINARNAIDFALAKIPVVDPQRLYTAGHSSAATQALLLAAKEPRIRGCIAYAPVVDVANDIRDDLPTMRTMVRNLDALLITASPKSNESRLRCPLFLFHARDDQRVPVSESIALAGRLKASGKVVELVTVSQGGHYDPMISEGIPRAIEWLKRIAAVDQSTASGLAGSGSTGAGLGQLESNPFAESPGMSAGADSSSPDEKSSDEKSPDEKSSDEGNTALADDDPFSESPFEPSTADDSSADTSMADSSSSDDSPFTESPFRASPTAGSGSSSAGGTKPTVSESRITGLLNEMESTSVFERRDAIKKIAQIDPESVTSESTRQAVVQQLNDLILGDDHFTRAEAVKALGKWGDSSSVNVLLGLLADRGNRSMSKDIYTTLGRLKDPASALVVAERLGDFFDRDAAEACLRQMGPVAEDALILVAPAGNKDTCLRAIKLLGDVGSEKCFEVLREAQRSRDVEIKEAGKFALRKIRLRQQTTADDESDDED